MDKVDVKKIIRCFIVAFLFLCMVNVWGIPTRQAHQLYLLLGTIILFSLILQNIWLTLFMWWSVLLFSYFKFSGIVYIQNLLLGSILYFLTKISFKKEHINFYLNGVLWLITANLLYMIVQAINMDVIYISNRYNGFMSASCFMGVLMSLGVPILLTRNNWIAYTGAILLLIPVGLSYSATNLAVCGVSILFIMWYKLNLDLKKKIIAYVSIIIAVLVMIILYIKYFDAPQMARLDMWKMVLTDCILHPVSGWGLDSFRNQVNTKTFMYALSQNKVWDNPHNLYLSLLFEWGIVSWILLGGYLRQCAIAFKRSIKSPNVLALSSMMIILFLISGVHFPMFIARMAVIFIPMFALYERVTE